MNLVTMQIPVDAAMQDRLPENKFTTELGPGIHMSIAIRLKSKGNDNIQLIKIININFSGGIDKQVESSHYSDTSSSHMNTDSEHRSSRSVLSLIKGYGMVGKWIDEEHN
jgi:hypothetical protein